jgi:GNAT superfamily N-acetyltransferase
MREALAFLHWFEEACAGRIEPFAYGRGFFRDELPNVWDLNFLRADRGEPDARELVAAADELMGNLEHRRVFVDDAALAGRLEPGFPANGWTVERHLVMEHRHPPEAGRATAAAEEASADQLRPFWAELDRRRGFVLGKRPVVAEAVPTRYFAGYADGVPVSCCELYSRGGIGQVEDVVTLEEHRGRGLASAAVLAALDASLDEGNTLTFLVADANDWPCQLYERLGFETTRRRWLFQRLPA